jgi:predicted DNA-binding transcriptional regulator AlpA
MHTQDNESGTSGNQAIERVPAAARRMAVSVSQVYREVKAGRLLLVKLGERASGIPVSSVDAWIQSKIDAAKPRG